MPKSSKSRWKFTFHRSSSTLNSSSSPNSSSVTEITEITPPSPPPSFVCSISSSLMSDPVILPSGHTFDRCCVEACVYFNFNPVTNALSDSPLSLSLIPNIALKSAITDWCDRVSVPHPSPLSPESARGLVGRFIMSQKSIEEVERLRLSPSSSSCSYPSSSSVSSLSSSSDSSMVVDNDSKKSKPNSEALLEEEIFGKLKSPQITIKELGLVSLKQHARESAHLRLSLCTERILNAVVPLISFPNPQSIQANATAAIVNLSVEQVNKVRIVRSGALPSIIDALNSNYSLEVQSNAAGALFSLALDDNNKLVIGVLGAIPLLVNLFCSHTNRFDARVEAGMALYHLSLAPNNISKIVKSVKAVKKILNVATYYDEEEKKDDDKVQKVAMMVLANLAKKNEGRAALMDAGAVKAMVDMLMMNLEVGYCLDLLYEMSKGSRMRFRVLANAAGAEKALMENKNIKVETMTRMLKIIRGGSEEIGVMSLLGLRDEVEQEDEVGSVVSDGLLSFRRRRLDDFGGNSGPNSANF